MPVSFFLSDPGKHKALVEELHAKASASRECKMAQGGSGMRPVAVESVVKVTPIPTG